MISVDEFPSPFDLKPVPLFENDEEQAKLNNEDNYDLSFNLNEELTSVVTIGAEPYRIVIEKKPDTGGIRNGLNNGIGDAICKRYGNNNSRDEEILRKEIAARNNQIGFQEPACNIDRIEIEQTPESLVLKSTVEICHGLYNRKTGE